MKKLGFVLAVLLLAAGVSACATDANGANPSVYERPATGHSGFR